ncbi:T9SS type A sorting domain-containing protein [Flavivirga aquimarina]|uniref:T9SS type A sorting domain-containing protein n=1 Tax=Flavivirga aquimarina TaxID=2027862 RepID=A0ABT8WHR3_9FLAO|nr:PA domain-containing protein [Flavivirga aquimarina]MDO5972536.1 T9SS type A sorting domain-containing protein [Flavivirga aquimarina]
MKKNHLLIVLMTCFLLGLYAVHYFSSDIPNDNSSIETLKSKHKAFLENSPFKETKKLSRRKRKLRGIPPNSYFEREWELTMNPELGRPTSENLSKIQKDIKNSNANTFARVSGDKTDNSWVERGPNNVGGRTRAIMFDPNDATNKIVFAGGVSGGIWKNTDITSSSSSWERVDIPENLSVTSLAFDPNDTDTFYAGTGESYVGGDVNGSGLWKSTDRGVTWERIFGGATANGEGAKLTVNVPGSIAGEYNALQAAFGSPLTEITGDLVLVDDGVVGLGTITDGCSTLVNGAAINGKIAVIERGVCEFDIKVKNAENAGAIAVVVVNNVSDPIIDMGGDDYTIYIPAIMVSQADGQAIMAQLGSTVNVTIEPDAIPSTGSFLSLGIQHINDVVVRDLGSTSEIYVAAAASLYADANPTGFSGIIAYGLYKSTDDGVTWTKIALPTNGANSGIAPNNIEIGQDNKIWISTTRSLAFPSDYPGGQVLSSSDGATFTIEHTITNGRRTEIAVSSSDPNKIYVLAELSSGTNAVELIRTDNAFTSTTTLALPDDVDTGIPSTDFTRGQTFYNLVIKVDPTNDANVFVGGIDLFKSSNSGTSWSQISKWSNNNNLSALSVPLVHADHHAITFGNNDASAMLFGNDGGVYYSSNGGTNINSRNLGYNVTQFYSVGVAPTTAITGDYFYGGTQDNGTQFFENSNSGVDSSVTNPTGGDGAATMVDQDGTDTYFIYNFVYNNSITKRDYPSGAETTINDEDLERGDFINQETLDSNLNILYTNYSIGSTYEIRRYDFSGAGAVNKSILSNGLLDGNPTAFAVSPFTTTSTTLLIGNENGKLIKVANADGAVTPTWTEIGSTNFIGSISDIEFGQSEADIFVTMHNYGVINIWYSSDGGTTWLEKEGDLPDLPVKAILQNPLNTEEVIVGTELGVWYTNNFSSTDPTWNPAFNGMSNAKVTDLDLRNDNAIYASTYGRGIFSGEFTATSLSVTDNELESQIKLYPTVSNGELVISANGITGKVDLQVFSLSGKSIYKSELEMNGRKKPLTLNGLSSGIYLVKFSKDNFSETKKIIIK